MSIASLEMSKQLGILREKFPLSRVIGKRGLTGK